MADFDQITLMTIGARFKDDVEECIRWCRQYGLMAVHMNCPTCNLPCNEQNRAVIDGKTWRCTVRACRKIINIRKGSFFEGSHLQLWQILGITSIWVMSAGKSRGLSVKDVQAQLDIGHAGTVVDWNQYCRDIAVQYFLNNPVQLGGPGRIVEIDESLFSRRKNNQGN